jgi:hypothetical protein
LNFVALAEIKRRQAEAYPTWKRNSTRLHHDRGPMIVYFSHFREWLQDTWLSISIRESQYQDL